MAADNTAARLRLTLELLQERGEQRRLELWDEVSRGIPLSDQENEVNTKGLLRGLTNWAFGSSDLVAAGWLAKDDGLWQTTETTAQALVEFSDPEQMLRAARRHSAALRTARRDQQQELLRSVIVSQGATEGLIREASALFVERGLRNGESVFVPGRAIWTRPVVDELSAAFLGAPDAPGSSFPDKVSAQLANASDDARLLMAELVAWQLLPSVSLGEHAKLARVDGVLALMHERVEIPHEIRTAFTGGVYRPGQRMSTQLHKALEVIIGVLDAWLALDSDEQEQCLESASDWAALVRSGRGEAFPTQRNSLNYLVRPEYFGPIVASTDRAAIIAAFSGELATRYDEADEQLFRIFLAVQQKAGTAINFYDEPYRSRWQASTSAESTEVPVDDDGEDLPADRAAFPLADAALRATTLFSGDWLQAALDVLEERRQVILYGPPGTGKTYVAQALAEHVTAESDAVEIVQFHPSYAYEDFFEGLRPVVGDTGLAYEVRHGPLRQLAERAQQNPELNYVLIIDEINRGNIAKIFGELYFLLEYRDRSVRLPYSGDRFTIPANVFVIGTMNSADRSIAALDAAMRRRFAFLELHPSRKPVEGVLRRWLRTRELPTDAADLLDALNARVPDDELRIGPSYLMSTGIASEGKLDSVWRYDLLPLLAEHHYGDGIDVQQRYGLAELRRVTENGGSANSLAP